MKRFMASQQDEVDERAGRIFLGDADPDDGAWLAQELARSSEARARFLDHALLQGCLVEEALTGRFGGLPSGKPAAEPVSHGPPAFLRGQVRWAAAIAATMAISVLSFLALQMNARAQVMRSLDQMDRALDERADRTYMIHVLEPGDDPTPDDNGRIPPGAYLDGARLYLRGRQQFVLEQQLPRGEQRLLGSDGVSSWSIRGAGPVRVSSNPVRFNGVMPGGRQGLAFLDLRSQLEELRTLYHLTPLPPRAVDEETTLRGIHGVRQTREQGGPREVEIWFDERSGTIQRMELDGLPREHGGPRSLALVLLSVQPLDAGFFQHNFHHEAGRPTVAEQER